MKDPLSRDESVLQIIKRLYERVATTYFTEFEGHLELEELGFHKFDGQQLISIISNPIYMGKIPHGDQLVEHERYAIVSEELWYEANARLPAKRDSSKKSKSQARWEEFCQIVDSAMLLTSVADAWFIRCPKCKKGKMRWDGVKPRAGRKIPYLGCNRQDCDCSKPVLTAENLETLLPGIKCLEPECTAIHREDFHHIKQQSGKYLTRCLRCGWQFVSKGKIFKHLDSKSASIGPSPRNSKGKQITLTNPNPQPQRGPGRRQSRQNKQ